MQIAKEGMYIGDDEDGLPIFVSRDQVKKVITKERDKWNEKVERRAMEKDRKSLRDNFLEAIGEAYINGVCTNVLYGSHIQCPTPMGQALINALQAGLNREEFA